VALQWRVSFLLVALFAPSQAVGQTDRSTDRGQQFTALRGERITRPMLFSFPTLIAVVGNKIVVFDFEVDTLGLVLESSTGRLLLRFGPSGMDVGEFLAPVAIDVDRESGNSFWVIDGRTRRATRLSFVSSSTAGLQIRTDSIVPLPGDTAIALVSSFRDSTGAIVLAGFFDGPRFVRIRGGGLGWEPFGPLPPGDSDVQLTVRQHAYQTLLARHPEGSRFAAATRYSDRIDIFALDGSRLASALRLRGFDPIYDIYRSVQSGAFRAGLDLRYAYISLTADRKGFFALYSGRNHLEARGHAASGAVIDNYDWSANRLRVYGTDDDLVAIAVDEPGRTIYGLVHGRAPAVVRYRLRD